MRKRLFTDSQIVSILRTADVSSASSDRCANNGSACKRHTAAWRWLAWVASRAGAGEQQGQTDADLALENTAIRDSIAKDIGAAKVPRSHGG
jgi:hypothetical protein